MPEPGSVMEFKNFKNMEKAPYTVYADFESIIDKESKVHTACGYGLNLVNSLGESLKFNIYRGEDCMERFFEELDEIEELVDSIPIAKMIITPEQEREFDNATHSYMCRKLAKDDPLVRDHDHVSGLYRGPAHNSCNLKHRQTKKIKVVFHNLKGYDSHLIVKAWKGRRVKCSSCRENNDAPLFDIYEPKDFWVKVHKKCKLSSHDEPYGNLQVCSSC
jgi:hypothetical protein